MGKRLLFFTGTWLQVWKNPLRWVLVFGMLGVARFTLAIDYPNPIEAEDFPTLIEAIAKALVLIGVPLAVLALIIAGFRFISGSISGSKDAIKEARSIFMWTLVGTAILVGAWAIASAVVNFAQTLDTGNP